MMINNSCALSFVIEMHTLYIVTVQYTVAAEMLGTTVPQPMSKLKSKVPINFKHSSVHR